VIRIIWSPSSFRFNQNTEKQLTIITTSHKNLSIYPVLKQFLNANNRKREKVYTFIHTLDKTVII